MSDWTPGSLNSLSPPTLVHKERSGEREKDHGDTRSLRSVVVAVVRKVFLLLNTSEVRWKACIVFFLWGASSMIYYGVSLNSYNLSTNLYIYTFLCGLLEIPAYLFNWPTSTKLGRKKTLVCLYLTCSVSISVLTALIMLLEEVDRHKASQIFRSGSLLQAAHLNSHLPPLPRMTCCSSHSCHSSTHLPPHPLKHMPTCSLPPLVITSRSAHRLATPCPSSLHVHVEECTIILLNHLPRC
ncbi:hypothetical protein Pcinc_008754 [Petrolisthes cinctipes]|uniref:Solute carrier family 22 member 15 n=1 Tax=Petrolisthes cinctipes TaxID=88211 RepID=A0AAE1G8D3_PETCI|nr:hypothetical protein Pcinc_008754 [Petrolisthes cinctipes]